MLKLRCNIFNASGRKQVIIHSVQNERVCETACEIMYVENLDNSYGRI